MNDFSYDLPHNFKARVVQYLKQKDKHLSEVFKLSSIEINKRGLAYYEGLKGDTWDKYAIDLTVVINKENLSLLERNKNLISDVVSKSLNSNESGLLLHDLDFLYNENNEQYLDIPDEIEAKFMEISTRQSNFKEMRKDEKMGEIVNLLENMLKFHNKYIELPYNKVCLDYISIDVIKRYRKQLHCFRHASENSIRERNSFSEAQKDFLIDYGITILKAVYALKNID